jgi:hypothetical protein
MLEKYVTHFGNQLKDDEWYEDEDNYPNHYLLTKEGIEHTTEDPVVQVFKLQGTDYVYLDVDSIDIDQSNNNVTIRVPKIPNGLFAGRIIII